MVLGAAGALGFALLVVVALWLRSDPDEASSTSQTPTSAQEQSAAPGSTPVASQREPQPRNTGANTTGPPDRHSSIAHGSKSGASPDGSPVARDRRVPETSAPVIVTVAEAHPLSASVDQRLALRSGQQPGQTRITVFLHARERLESDHN
jgi:hypothetical protein